MSKKQSNNNAINCLEGLIDSIVGNTDRSDKSRLIKLAEHMIKHSFFFSKDAVDERHKEILKALDNGEPLPARYSTVTKKGTPYFDKNGTPLTFTNKREANKHGPLNYKFNDDFIYAQVDRDGNRSVRDCIRNATGHIVSEGTKNTISYAIISHIWGNAFNPLMFTSLWNLAIIPAYCNPIMDKNEESQSSDLFSEEVSFVKNAYKKICYDYYDVETKLADFKQRGFDLTSIVSCPDIQLPEIEPPSFPKMEDENDVLTIKDGVVTSCEKNAVKVVVPENVTDIGTHAFYDQASLTSVIIPSSVRTIGDRAFFGCASLSSVVIPESVKEIGVEAFGRCESLKSVVIPKGVTSIGKYVFSGCESLESLVISTGVTSIGESAFENCTSLSSVVIPGSVTSIGRDAFANCTSLESIEYGENLAQWKAVEKGVDWNENVPAMIVNCSDDVWRKTVLRLEDDVVVECLDKKIKRIVIPFGIKEIGDNVFQDCTSLESVVISDDVRTIGFCAFSGCTSLVHVDIPVSVIKIDRTAFDGCTSLSLVEYKGTKDGWNILKHKLQLSKSIPAKVVKCSDGDVPLSLQ